VQRLLLAGADPTATNAEGKKPIDLATDPQSAAELKRASSTEDSEPAGDYGGRDYEASDDDDGEDGRAEK